MEKEIRSLTTDQAQIRSDPKTGRITGYAIVFNSLSSLLFGKFYERILPEAATDLVKNSDVLALLDHNRFRGVLGRSEYGAGSLSLTLDGRGLAFSFDPPNTTLGEEVKEYLVRGDIKGSSFDMTGAKVVDKWEKTNDGHYIRTIKELSMIQDISLAFKPAYPATSVALRSLDSWIQGNDPDVNRLSLEGLNQYYKDLEEQMKQFEV